LDSTGFYKKEVGTFVDMAMIIQFVKGEEFLDQPNNY
jgi:hypothetical protein